MRHEVIYRLRLSKTVVNSKGETAKQVGYITFAHNIDKEKVFQKARQMSAFFDMVEIMEAPLVFDSVIGSFKRRRKAD